MVAGEDAAASEGKDAVVSEKMVESGDAVAVKETVTGKDAAAVEEMEMTVAWSRKEKDVLGLVAGYRVIPVTYWVITKIG